MSTGMHDVVILSHRCTCVVSSPIRDFRLTLIEQTAYMVGNPLDVIAFCERSNSALELGWNPRL